MRGEDLAFAHRGRDGGDVAYDIVAAALVYGDEVGGWREGNEVVTFAWVGC